METDMTANIPVLPLAAGSLARGIAGLAVAAARWGKVVATALRHRREARQLAGLDQYMLADLGINRADVNDAFSTPLWEDPTVLLRERVQERRLYRAAPLAHAPRSPRPPQPLPTVEPGFHRLPTDRSARLAV
jgi:uncharacterized protein YjiS (DUF1127 family)